MDNTLTKGIRYGRSYGSMDDTDTVITIEADESTPLLVDQKWDDQLRRAASEGNAINYNNNKNRLDAYERYSNDAASSMSSYPSSVWSHQGSIGSTKSFKSHFSEFRVLMFAFVVLAGMSIAIYLLIIESRLPTITFSLDLVQHDIWSSNQWPLGHRMESSNINRVVLMETGTQNCDNALQCLNVLHHMQQANYKTHEELPYNFLIGGDGETYEVRGWDHESGMAGVPQSSTLVIGIIGTFLNSHPPEYLLRTARFLIKESLKRRKLQRNYQLQGYQEVCDDCH